MTVAASVIIGRAQKILLDTSGVRWDSTELLGWVNDAQREVSIYKPAESIRRDAVLLVAGTYQRLAADATQLLQVVCNLRSTSPRIAGRSVTPVARHVLDAMHPRWQESDYFPFAAEAKHFAPDDVDIGAFHVFPGNDGTGHVEVVIAVPPAILTDAAQLLSVRDVYANAVLDYVLYRAFSKDSESANTSERAGGHYAMFSAAIGIKATVEG
jgi:hypothetical protein